MPQTARVLTHQQAKAFYDWMGTKQDLQAFYEGPATRHLIAHADFATAHAVFECGCGTGAFAEQVLASHLPPEARYVAVDSSTTMVCLAKTRLTCFGSRVDVRQSDGSLQFEAASGSFDRFVSNYVIDLLSVADIALLLSEAHRMLVPHGYLCLVSLTHGSTWPSRFVTGLWTRIHALRPALVGGCRPLAPGELLPATHWQVRYAHVVTTFGIPSEVVVASRLDV
jgi:ubiquinone/menaquinone biosynthesis C-methylase UbiE